MEVRHQWPCWGVRDCRDASTSWHASALAQCSPTGIDSATRSAPFCCVESFDVSVLLGLARLDVLRLYTPLLGPSLDALADVLRTVVAADRIWFAPPLNDVLEASDHPLAGQTEINF